MRIFPSFSAASDRLDPYALTLAATDDRSQLTDRVDSMLADPKKYDVETKGDQTIIEMSDLMSKTTLDIIGLAGFDYSFDQLSSEPGNDNELASVFKKMMKPRDVTPAMIAAQVLLSWFPILARLPTTTARAIAHSRDVMHNTGQKMLDIRMKQAEAGELEDKTDLLSLVVKENLRVTDPKDRLPDDEVMGQVRDYFLGFEMPDSSRY